MSEKQTMRVPAMLISAAVSVILAIQAWTLTEIVNLKIEVARLSERVSMHTTQTQNPKINEITSN